ncbi:MAG: BatA domain-containing protein [Phycisphaerae bacterium]
MPFIHPGIFWTGLAAVAAPVVIHLLSRRRFRVRYWAAMRFLLESLRENRRRLRIEELILLLLRCLIVLVLALGLARFTGCVSTGVLGDDATKTVVYVLDDSPSMTQTAGDTSAFASAKEDLSAALSKLGRQDRIAVITTSSASGDEPVLPLSFVGELDLESLSARLETLPASDVSGRTRTALERADEILRDVDAPGWLVLMSDFRAGDYSAGGSHQRLRERFGSIRQAGAKIVAMDYARPPRDNLTVRDVELLENFAVADTPAHVRVTVQNNSPASVTGVEVGVDVVTLSEAGDFVEASLPVSSIDSIEPGGRGHCELAVTFPQPGPAVLRAEIAADELDADNVAHLAVDVREAVRVLVVDGNYRASGSAGAATFLTRALDPNGDGGYGYRLDIIAPERLADTDLADYHMLALLNVPRFSPEASQPVGTGDSVENATELHYPKIAAIESFARQGGGVLIFTGPRVNTRFYNRRFYRGGEGILPVPLGAALGESDMPGGFVRLDSDSIRRQSPLRVFAGEGAGLLQLIRFYGFTRTAPSDELADAANVNVLARYTDRDRSPAVVSRQFGRGRVMLFTTTADRRWTDWPVEPLGSYVAVMVETVNVLARPQTESINGTVGRPIVTDITERMRDAKVSLKTPRYPEVEKLTLMPRTDERNRRRVRYDRAEYAGVYTLELTPPVGEPLRVLPVRNINPDEGDLAPAGESGLSAAIGDEQFDYVQRVGARRTDTAGMDDHRDYWRWAVAAVLVMLATETLLARRFGHYSNG